MALRDDVQTIRDRAITSLNSANDYHAYTKDAWRTLQQAVQRDGWKFSWRNRHTDSSITEKDVPPLAQRYVQIELAASTLQQFVSIFENFLFDTARVWLLAYPEHFSKRQLSAKDIFALADKAAIVDALLEKELKDVFYDRPANWFGYIKDIVKISSPTDAEARQFAEIKATRDVLVHGQGVANAYYVDKAGTAARSQPGQRLDVPDVYHQQSWELICRLVRKIGSEVSAKA